jgi:hypothetical protein
MKITLDGKTYDFNRLTDADMNGVPDILEGGGDDDSVSDIIQPSELGDAMKELNKDELDQETQMSGIDMRSRLHPIEVGNILALDSLVNFKCLPKHCLNFTRQKKRLSVSILGKGRTEIVDIVTGQRDHNEAKGFGEKMAGFFGKKKKENGG